MTTKEREARKDRDETIKFLLSLFAAILKDLPKLLMEEYRRQLKAERDS